MYGSDGLHARRQLRELAASASTPSRSSTSAVRILAARAAGARSAPVASRMTRVYSCAGHTRADAMRAALAHAQPAASSSRGRQQQPRAARAGARARRDSASRAGAARGRSRSGIAHPPPCARRARSRVRPRPDRRDARASSVEIRRGQQPGDALRPFDQADRIVAEALGKSRCLPFVWIGEPIKIKVIEV